jgi:hypothetical protein
VNLSDRVQRYGLAGIENAVDGCGAYTSLLGNIGNGWTARHQIFFRHKNASFTHCPAIAPSAKPRNSARKAIQKIRNFVPIRWSRR